MGSTIFVALQCCQCSTMQVKQKKKSSNKWVCVVCNQKQSVRKVFAQGYAAKELRFFVQSFNMSRKSAEEDQDRFSEAPEAEDHDDGEDLVLAEKRKRRTDWSEYIDHPKCCQRARDHQAEDEDGDDSEPKVFTEMLKEMFKKPRLKNYVYSSGPSATGEASSRSKPFKPVFSRKNSNECFAGRDKDPKNDKAKKPRTDNLPMQCTAPKWSEYMTPGEDWDEPQLSQRDNPEDDLDEWTRAVFEISTTDQKVEDDIHPDFL